MVLSLGVNGGRMNIRIKSFVILAAGVAVGGSLAYFLTMRYAEAQAKAMYHVGVEHHDEGKIDLSIAVLNRAVGKDSTISGPLQLLGRIYSAKGGLDLALDTYSDALENIGVKTNRIDYYMTLCSIADLNIKKGNKKEGMRIYTTVINEFPHKPIAK